METPVLGPTGPSCQMHFYYHMFGISAGLLNYLLNYINITILYILSVVQAF